MTRIPWRLIGYAVFALFVIGGLNHYAGFIPFTPQWSAKRAVAKVERLEGEVDTLQREAAGNDEIRQATNTYHTREIIYRDLQSQADNEARTAPDADTPLPAERLARHLRNDERVCLDATFVCARLDAPLSGAGAVPTDDAP